MFSHNAQAQETARVSDVVAPALLVADLLEIQIFPRADRGMTGLDTLEDVQLRPTPFGELVDVVLSDAPGRVLLTSLTLCDPL